MPIIGSAKYSIKLSDEFSFALGSLLGTGSWAKPDMAIALPFGSLTWGDRRRNITFSGGYGAAFYKEEIYNYTTNTTETNHVNDGRVLLSVAGMAKVAKKISIVFDSFIVPPGDYYTSYQSQYNPGTGIVSQVPVRQRREGFALLLPGIRWQMESNKAFQFGFAGLSINGSFVPLPIPFVQWYRKL